MQPLPPAAGLILPAAALQVVQDVGVPGIRSNPPSSTPCTSDIPQQTPALQAHWVMPALTEKHEQSAPQYYEQDDRR